MSWKRYEIKNFPKVIYEKSETSKNIDEVLNRLEEHQIISSKEKKIAKEQLLRNDNCGLILVYLNMLDDLRLEIGSQSSMLRKGIGRALDELNSPILYHGE